MLDQIAEALFEVVANSKDPAVAELRIAMKQFESEQPVAHRQLMSVFAFSRLWNALKEGTIAAD